MRIPVVVALALLLPPMAAAARESAKLPGYSIRRVVSQRPAMVGAFDPAGSRFVFVHRDQLWLSEKGNARRIGYPAVDNVYRAAWVSAYRILVSHVVPGAGDALGTLDLADGRFRPLAKGVHEDDFSVSRRGGLVVWRARPPWAPTREAWMAAAVGSGARGVRLAREECAALALPAPGGDRVAGLAYGLKPCLHLAPAGGAVPLSVGAAEIAIAAAWAPDGRAVAFLLSPAPAGVPLAPEAAASAATEPAAERQTLAIYRVGAAEPEVRQALPAPCVEVAWDAEGAGIFCRSEGPDPGIWYAPVAPRGEPRRIYSGGVRQIAVVAGGCALAVVPASEKPGLSRLYLLSARGGAPLRVTNTPSFDHLDDVSSDFRKVLVTRRPKDDRQSLFPEATLWAFELR